MQRSQLATKEYYKHLARAHSKTSASGLEYTRPSFLRPLSETTPTVITFQFVYELYDKKKCIMHNMPIHFNTSKPCVYVRREYKAP